MAAVFTITTVAIFGLAQLFFTTSAKDCAKPPPGIQRMYKGVDITKLDLLPMQDFGNNGFNNPVIKSSCDKGKKWKSPTGVDYDLPDQIWHMESLPGGWMSANAELYKTYHEVRDSLAVDVGVEGTIKNFAFSSSLSYKKMETTITNTSKYISDTGAFVSATTADMQPSGVLALDDHTKAYVDKDLKGTYETNPNAYNGFINTFGTHFFYRANFGGYIREVREITSEYFLSSTEDSVKFQAQASYMNAISVKAGVEKSSMKIDGKFLESSSQTIKFYGGSANLLETNGMSKWQPTVANDPWLFSGKLKPISDLFSDETKKRSMEKAVEQYVFRSYLDELERLISFAKTKTNDAVLNSLQTKVLNMKQLKTLVQKDIEALNSEIDYNIKLPYWFKTSTSLCFKWWGDSDGSQCGGGGIANELCVPPNKMTQFYRDDTDIRIGGCMMQWGITSNGYDDWFNKVQVCFRFYNDGDECQCGERKGSARERCVSINRFTEAYKDDTDARVGGCMMSWRLIVPSNAPLWMRTSKMCFSWYPDVGGDECGPAPSRDMCAVANDWTPYYRDNTHDFGGGCRMSWGIKTVFN